MKRRQQGLATVEFAIVGLLAIVVFFSVIEFGRLLWLWNTLGEATRRAARAAAVCPVDHPAPANVAVFKVPDIDDPNNNDPNPVVAGLAPTNISVQYLDSTGSTTAVFQDIRYVRASITGYSFRLNIPTWNMQLGTPAFATTLPRESLGIVPGVPACQCFGIEAPCP